jgi:O-methyltransferase involved in polyketide biosynthesis
MPIKSAGDSYEKISPTAWGVAWCRTFTDIPFSKEIFEQLKKRHKASGMDSSTVALPASLIPMFEGRYKLVNRLLAQTNIKNVIELAAGFSQRGLELTKDLEVAYVELDLPQIIQEKKEIIEAILKNSTRPNLNLIAGNALSKEDLKNAMDVFKPGEKIAIINEGLLRYLTHEEKAVVASNVFSILKERGGVWITPDIPIKSAFERISSMSDEMGKRSRDVEKMTGINKETNYFKDENVARNFFEDKGFIVEKHPFLEVFDELSSPKNLSLPAESVRALLEPFMVFVMRVR